MWFLLLFVLPELSIHKQIQATIKLFKKKKQVGEITNLYSRISFLRTSVNMKNVRAILLTIVLCK